MNVQNSAYDSAFVAFAKFDSNMPYLLLFTIRMDHFPLYSLCQTGA